MTKEKSNPNGFNDVAFLYDALFTESEICKYQRKIVWQYLKEKLPPHKTILETNCGTGEDAIFLSQQGHTVTATDGAENMIDITKNKFAKYQIQNVNIFLWNLNEQFPQAINKQFDIIYSNFGGWNCLNGDAITKLSAELNTLLKPGGKLIVILITKFSWWETFYYILKVNLKQAFRRFRNKPVRASLTHDAFIQTYYHSTKNMKKYLYPYFKLQKKLPAGFFVPPSYLEGFFVKHPRFLKYLFYADLKTRNLSFLTFGADQYILEFERI